MKGGLGLFWRYAGDGAQGNVTLNGVIQGEHGIREGKEHASVITGVGAARIAMVAAEGIETGVKGWNMETILAGDGDATNREVGHAMALHRDVGMIGEANKVARCKGVRGGVEVGPIFEEVVCCTGIGNGMAFNAEWRGVRGRLSHVKGKVKGGEWRGQGSMAARAGHPFVGKIIIIRGRSGGRCWGWQNWVDSFR